MTRIRLLALEFALVAGASFLGGQTQPGAQSSADSLKRSAEWNSLASTLETRLARLLPCDPRVAMAIEEVARASDARIAASIDERKGYSAKSQQQIEVVKTILAEQQASSTGTQSEPLAEQERNDIQAQLALIGDVARRSPPFAPAAKSLDGIQQSVQQSSNLAARGQKDYAEISAAMSDWLVASQGRQRLLDLDLKALADEGSNWRAYYAARSARAKAECTITNPGGNPDAPPRPRTRRAKGKSPK